MRSVLMSKKESQPAAWGRGGSIYMTKSHMGCTFDGRRLYMMGGGDKAYGGNEIYMFDLETLAWSRLTEPSLLNTPEGEDGPCAGYASDADGNPAPPAMKVYDGLVYHPGRHALYLWGRNPYCYKRHGGGRTHTWRFDLQDKHWEWIDIEMGKKAVPFATAVDPATGQILLVGSDKVAAFDPDRPEVFRSAPRRFYGTAEVDPAREQVLVHDEEGIRAAKLGPPPGALTLRLSIDEIPSPSDITRFGMARHTGKDVMILWGGNREVLLLDPATWKVDLYPNLEGPAPKRSTAGVYGSWVYVPSHDVFVGVSNPREGVWLYRLPGPEKAAVPPPPTPPTIAGDARVCPPGSYSEQWCGFTSLRKAIEQAKPGSRIVLAPGRYYQAAKVDVPGLTLIGEPGAHLSHRAEKGKAALVVTAPNVTIDGIECSDIEVSDNNGACVRIEGADTTLRNVYFHDNQQGVLGGVGTVRVENSTFERNGLRGKAHGLYILSKTDKLIFANNRILSTKGQGHGLKSRAKATIVTGNVIADFDSNDSRAIDIPNGGMVTITGNVLQKGRNSDNHDMIGLAREIKKGLHEQNETIIENNIFIFDREKTKTRLLTSDSPGAIHLRNNVIVNSQQIGAEVIGSGNRSYSTRTKAGFPPYPGLPDLPRAQ
jgi:nitrous oxidase accessory protein NosD